MSQKINLTINGQKVSVDAGTSVMKAADTVGIDIPRLCFLEGIHEEGNCRLCVVEIKGQRGLKPSCRTTVYDGMEVTTDTKEIYSYVSMNLELLAANHHFECFKCSREENCEFLDLLRQFSVGNEFSDLFGFQPKEMHLNDTSDAMILDSSKCILCGRCVSACEKMTGLGILNFNKRGTETYVGPAQYHPLEDSGCIYCGKCIQACPVGAIREHDDIKKLEYALRDKEKTVIVQVAPSVRVALGEEFGLPMGTNVEGKMYAALKQIGIKEIIDTNFTADLTIIEEGTELLERIRHDGVLPMFTSCSPGWVNYLETYAPEFIPNVSSCKSPQQMAGALIKTYYADKLNLDPKNIVSVSIMPCVAKKHEAKRPEMGRDGYQDVDIVLTTREFGRLIRRRNIDFKGLKPIKPFGELAKYTGAASIFGASGGVMEAALRTVSELLMGDSAPLEFMEVRGKENIKEATYKINDMDLNIAVVHGGVGIEQFLNMVRNGEKQYHFVEFMGCIGGCINGGGQPIIKAKELAKIDVIKERSKALYVIDENATFRKSHENPAVKKLYEEFLSKLSNHKVHDLLHTHYHERNRYSK